MSAEESYLNATKGFLSLPGGNQKKWCEESDSDPESDSDSDSELAVRSQLAELREKREAEKKAKEEEEKKKRKEAKRAAKEERKLILKAVVRWFENSTNNPVVVPEQLSEEDKVLKQSAETLQKKITDLQNKITYLQNQQRVYGSQKGGRLTYQEFCVIFAENDFDPQKIALARWCRNGKSCIHGDKCVYSHEIPKVESCFNCLGLDADYFCMKSHLPSFAEKLVNATARLRGQEQYILNGLCEELEKLTNPTKGCEWSTIKPKNKPKNQTTLFGVSSGSFGVLGEE